MKTIVFVIDYVMHYHRDILRAIALDTKNKGGRFVLLTASHQAPRSGRVPLETPVVDEQSSYRLYEGQIGSVTLRYQRGLVQTIRHLRPDIVVTTCHAGTVSEWCIAMLRRSVAYKLVAWQCGYDYNPGRVKDAVLSRFVPLFDHHLAYHSNAKRYALRYGAEDRQVTLMHNTIDERRIERMDRGRARQQLDARFPTLTGRIIVLYVGAVLSEKRLDLVVDALDQLNDGRIGFLVVGDGSYMKTLQSRCAGRDDVVFAGRIVEEVGPLFDGADVFVLPGTGGLALNEAMIHGLPVVAGYADGSADDLIQDGVNGYRLRHEDAAELAERLLALAKDAALRTRMGVASRELVTTKFSFSRFVQRVTDVLDAL